MKLAQKLIIFSFTSVFAFTLNSQTNFSRNVVLETMLNATKYMVEDVSYNGGYVWYYMPDFSRQWGEMEAYKTMVWLQHPGTISMGHVFLDAFRVTKNEYYYHAAEKAASAIIWGQSYEGGWNYMIDFAGDRSLKQWYNTIGKNGWRLEEFQHYYGNSTFDDDVTSDAARFLMRIYLEKMDPKYKPIIDKAIGFILKSQYPNGGWPQRYPYVKGFETDRFPDYTPFYTFNDDVIWENINFLMQCYLVLGEERFLEPIYKGMNFYKLSQEECGAWGQQLNMNMETASARTYEPAAFLPRTTCENALLLIKFYRLTGDKVFLEGVPKAISWLENVKLPDDKIEGHRTYPTFIDIKTNKPIYVHRRGANVANGEYYINENDKDLLAHYYGKTYVQLDYLKEEYDMVLSIPEEEITKNSPLKPKQYNESETPQRFYDLNRYVFNFEIDEEKIYKVINDLDDKGRWLTTRAYISNPYIGNPQYTEPTNQYSTTRVGDKFDTSPYPNRTDQEYISTGTYIRNMKLLINYINNK